jgi:hypothetical protein
VSARFFGLAPERPAPKSIALMGATEPTDAIQLGIFGVSPGAGRLVHC